MQYSFQSYQLVKSIPQYITGFASEHLRKFGREWSFSHVPSSPHFPQSNGALRTIKGLLKSSDPHLGLMADCAAPLANGHSPAELPMGRKIRTPVPVIPPQFNPGWTDMDNRTEAETEHRTRNKPLLHWGDCVWVKDIRERGTVIQCRHSKILHGKSPTPSAPATLTDMPEEAQYCGANTTAVPAASGQRTPVKAMSLPESECLQRT